MAVDHCFDLLGREDITQSITAQKHNVAWLQPHAVHQWPALKLAEIERAFFDIDNVVITSICPEAPIKRADQVAVGVGIASSGVISPASTASCPQR
jgi:hypothetical protein